MRVPGEAWRAAASNVNFSKVRRKFPCWLMNALTANRRRVLEDADREKKRGNPARRIRKIHASRWEGRAGERERRDCGSVPESVRQLHDRAVVVFIAVVVMNCFVPSLVDRQGEAGPALEKHHGDNQRPEELENGEMAMHGGFICYMQLYCNNKFAVLGWTAHSVAAVWGLRADRL